MQMQSQVRGDSCRLHLRARDNLEGVTSIRLPGQSQFMSKWDCDQGEGRAGIPHGPQTLPLKDHIVVLRLGMASQVTLVYALRNWAKALTALSYDATMRNGHSKLRTNRSQVLYGSLWH